MKILKEKKVCFTVEMLKVFYPFYIPEDIFSKMVELYQKSFAILILLEGENVLSVS